MAKRGESARYTRCGAVAGVHLLEACYLDHRFARHTHAEAVIGANVGGVARFLCRGRIHTLAPGQVALIDSGEVHTGQRVGSEPWEYRALHVDPEMLGAFAAEEAPLRGVEPRFTRPVVSDPELAAEVIEVHRLLEGAIDPREAMARLRRLLVGCLVRYAEFPTGSPRRRKAESDVVRRVREHLEAHFAERVSLQDLSDLAGLSRFHLLRVFRREVGLPPNAYLQVLRVERARELLRDGASLPLAAAETGFASPSHFTRQFKRIVGVPPGAYARGVREPGLLG